MSSFSKSVRSRMTFSCVAEKMDIDGGPTCRTVWQSLRIFNNANPEALSLLNQGWLFSY
jgi:hypothetical protein